MTKMRSASTSTASISITKTLTIVLIAGIYCNNPVNGNCCTEDQTGIDTLCCENDGICKEDVAVNSDFHQNVQGDIPLFCECKRGWGGRTCEEEIDCCDVPEDQPNLCCRNGGLCVNNGGGDFECSCKNGFGGFQCELDCCDDDSLCCANDGFCVQSGTTITVGNESSSSLVDYCVCPEGFGGENCEFPTEVCGDDEYECYNGGECYWKGASGWGCSCPASVSPTVAEEGQVHLAGERCEIQATSICYRDDEGTITSFCANGGECIAEELDHKGCTCPPGFEGFYCEHEGSTSGSSNSESSSSSSDDADQSKQPSETEKVLEAVEDNLDTIEKFLIAIIVIVGFFIFLCIVSYCARNNTRLKKRKSEHMNGLQDTSLPSIQEVNGAAAGGFKDDGGMNIPPEGAFDPDEHPTARNMELI